MQLPCEAFHMWIQRIHHKQPKRNPSLLVAEQRSNKETIHLFSSKVEPALQISCHNKFQAQLGTNLTKGSTHKEEKNSINKRNSHPHTHTPVHVWQPRDTHARQPSDLNPCIRELSSVQPHKMVGQKNRTFHKSYMCNWALNSC